MPRKVIQIATNGGGHQYYPCIVALCDDGTIWEKNYDKDGYKRWDFIDEVPQGSLEDLDLMEATCVYCGLAKRNKYIACSSCGGKQNKE